MRVVEVNITRIRVNMKLKKEQIITTQIKTKLTLLLFRYPIINVVIMLSIYSIVSLSITENLTLCESKDTVEIIQPTFKEKPSSKWYYISAIVVAIIFIVSAAYKYGFSSSINANVTTENYQAELKKALALKQELHDEFKHDPNSDFMRGYDAAFKTTEDLAASYVDGGMPGRDMAFQAGRRTDPEMFTSPLYINGYSKGLDDIYIKYTENPAGMMNNLSGILAELQAKGHGAMSSSLETIYIENNHLIFLCLAFIVLYIIYKVRNKQQDIKIL